jgi:hypothetical protein
MMGDAAGVRPEVIMKSIAHPGLNGLCRSIVIDDGGRLEEAGRMSAATLRASLHHDEFDQATFHPRYGRAHQISVPATKNFLESGIFAIEFIHSGLLDKSHTVIF